MAKFGHVLVLYNCTPDQIEDVAVIIMSAAPLIETVDNSIFFQTTDKDVTKSMLDLVEATGHKFSVFHNQVPSGSYFRCNGIDEETKKKIKKIFSVK